MDLKHPQAITQGVEAVTASGLDDISATVLHALRRIVRAIDQYSRKLARDHNITGPQLLCLYLVERQPEHRMTIGALSREAHLGPSTINGIVDRLELRALARRERDNRDRRRVYVCLTEEGAALTAHAPSLLQDRLAEGLQGLPDAEKKDIARALQRVATLMEVKPPTPARASGA